MLRRVARVAVANHSVCGFAKGNQQPLVHGPFAATNTVRLIKDATGGAFHEYWYATSEFHEFHWTETNNSQAWNRQIMWQLHCLKSIGVWLFILSFGAYLGWWSPKIRQQLDGESMAGYAGSCSIMQRKVSCCSPRHTMRWARRSESEIGLWKAMAKCRHVRPVRIEHQVVGDFSWLYIRFPLG